MRRKRWFRPLVGGILLGAFLPGTSGAESGETVYPHDTRITDCTDCHTEDIYTEDCHGSDNFCLTAKSVDDLCLHCHLMENCCRVGQEHQSRLFLGERTHPSDIDIRDVSTANLPRVLPTHKGRITCRTCHLHSRAAENDYRMLRLVEMDGDEVDCSVLCADCHKEYCVTDGP